MLTRSPSAFLLQPQALWSGIAHAWYSASVSWVSHSPRWTFSIGALITTFLVESVSATSLTTSWIVIAILLSSPGLPKSVGFPPVGHQPCVLAGLLFPGEVPRVLDEVLSAVRDTVDQEVGVG